MIVDLTDMSVFTKNKPTGQGIRVGDWGYINGTNNNSIIDCTSFTWSNGVCVEAAISFTRCTSNES